MAVCDIGVPWSFSMKWWLSWQLQMRPKCNAVVFVEVPLPIAVSPGSKLVFRVSEDVFFKRYCLTGNENGEIFDK